MSRPIAIACLGLTSTREARAGMVAHGLRTTRMLGARSSIRARGAPAGCVGRDRPKWPGFRAVMGRHFSLLELDRFGHFSRPAEAAGVRALVPHAGGPGQVEGIDDEPTFRI